MRGGELSVRGGEFLGKRGEPPVRGREILVRVRELSLSVGELPVRGRNFSERGEHLVIYRPVPGR